MNLSYDEIIREVQILARPYSQNHFAYSKWRSYSAKATEEPDSYLTIHDIEDKTYALIYRPNLYSFEAFQFDTIIKRTTLKRQESLYKEISLLWKTLNPFHLPGINKNVYLKFYEFIHFSVLNTNASADEIGQISKDVSLDFGEAEILNFIQFIDSIFECIDAFAKSMLVSEYCRVVKKLASEVRRSNWVKNIDLHSKMYCEGIKPVIPNWAHFKSRSIEIPDVSFKLHPLTPNLPDRIMARSVRRERDSFEITLMKFTNPWERRAKFTTSLTPKSPESSRKSRPHHSRARAELVDPLAKKNKNFRDREIIEGVVKERFEKIPNIQVKIVRTPLRYLM